jgi:hypothetical protein
VQVIAAGGDNDLAGAVGDGDAVGKVRDIGEEAPAKSALDHRIAGEVIRQRRPHADIG